MSYCPNCGTKIEPFDAIFCRNCGQSVNATINNSAQSKNKTQSQDSVFIRSTTHWIFLPTTKTQKWIQSLTNMNFGILLVLLLIPIVQVLQIQFGKDNFLFFWNGSHRILLLIALMIILRNQSRSSLIIGVYLLLLIWDFTGFILQYELESIGRNPYSIGVPSLTDTYAVLIIGTFITIGVSLMLLTGLKRNPKIVGILLKLTIMSHLVCKFIMWISTNQKGVMESYLDFERTIAFILVVYFTLSFISTISSRSNLKDK